MGCRERTAPDSRAPQLAFRLQIGGPHGGHGAGNGTRYRATVIGPGVTPDVMWQGPAPAPYDPSADAQANAAQRELLANDRRCVVN